MTITRRVGILFAALAIAALGVTPALAATINQDQVPTTAAEWTAANPDKSAAACTGDEVPQAGEAKWHFILNGAGSGQTVTLTAYFEDAEGNPVPPITAVGDEADHSGTYHFYVTTPDDYTLVNATTDETGSSINLVLSHVCLGTPPVVVPEAPATALLAITAGLMGLFFVFRRRSAAAQTTAV